MIFDTVVKFIRKAKIYILFQQKDLCGVLSNLKISGLDSKSARERPLMMSDFKGGWGVWNDPKKLDIRR